MTIIPAPAGLWRRWFLVVTVGELVGFTVPAVVGVVTASAAGAVQIPALVAPPLWQEGQAVGTIIAIGVLGALVMAATVAALTGLAALRLARAAAAVH